MSFNWWRLAANLWGIGRVAEPWRLVYSSAHRQAYRQDMHATARCTAPAVACCTDHLSVRQHTHIYIYIYDLKRTIRGTVVDTYTISAPTQTFASSCHLLRSKPRRSPRLADTKNSTIVFVSGNSTVTRNVWNSDSIFRQHSAVTITTRLSSEIHVYFPERLMT